jgi:precorrin-2 dehydrogenase/sirohydrochlorin ferrochelatase
MEYPIFLDIRDRLCVVVGGGPVGWRKAKGLAEAGARVRLISARVYAEWKERSDVEIYQREYRPGDLRGAFLAFAATDDRNVNAAVAEEARREKIPVNVVDAPEEGDFSLPARFNRGDLTVAVSTNGKSPAFAVLVKDFLQGVLSGEWAVFLEMAAAIRRRALTEGLRSPSANEIFTRLLEKNMPNLINCKDFQAIDAALEEVLGPDYTLESLGISISAPDI